MWRSDAHAARLSRWGLSGSATVDGELLPAELLTAELRRA